MTDESIDKLREYLSPGISDAERLENLRQIDEASKLIGLPINDWPNFDVVWNLNPKYFRFSFDGFSMDDLHSVYPNGLTLSEVNLSELDNQLCNYNRRTAEEVWDVGFDSKAARVLLSWIEGLAISPPVIARKKNTDEICLHGGNHRLAVARAKGEAKLPILICPSNFQFVSDKIALKSIMTSR